MKYFFINMNINWDEIAYKIVISITHRYSPFDKREQIIKYI